MFLRYRFTAVVNNFKSLDTTSLCRDAPALGWLVVLLLAQLARVGASGLAQASHWVYTRSVGFSLRSRLSVC